MTSPRGPRSGMPTIAKAGITSRPIWSTAKIGATAIALIGLTTACTSTPDATSTSPSLSASSGRTVSTQPPPPLDTCGGVTGTWTTLPGTPTAAASTGHGPVVVFANQSGNRVCDWVGLAQTLAGQGYRCVVFTYTDPSAAHEKQSVEETLNVARAATGGTNPFALIGASLGGRVVIEAAAQHPANLALIISLSGEETVQDYPDILPAAGQVTTPTLYVGATDDPLTQGVIQQNALHAAMHGQPNDILQIPGTQHGTAMIAPPTDDNTKTNAALITFLRNHLQP